MITFAVAVADVRVVADSCSDLPAELVERHRITIVPLTVRFGEQEFVDGRDLTPTEFWDRCARFPGLPETAAPPPGAFEEAFRSLAGSDGVVCITLSSTFSSTFQSAQMAAKALEDVVAVRVVDSRSTSLGTGMVVLHAARKAAEGTGLDEVVAEAETTLRRSRLVLALDTLENLKKGGRIGGAEALLGSLLSIKPVIEVRDGAVLPCPKHRTRSRALRYVIARLAAEADVSEVGVMHAAAPDLDEFLDLLYEHVPRERIVLGDIGAAIGTHTGAAAMGVTYRAR